MHDYENAENPNALKMMFIYENGVQNDYEEESRVVTRQFQKEVLNPLREVAKIEMKRNRETRKKLKLQKRFD